MKYLFIPLILILLISCKGEDDSICAGLVPYEEMERRTYIADGIEKISLKTVNGDLTASVNLDSLISIDIVRYCLGCSLEDAKNRLNNIKIIESISNGQILMEASMPADDPSQYEANFSVIAPDSVELIMNTINGHLSIDSWKSDVFCSAINGSISAIEHLGDLRILSTNGSIYCTTLPLDTTNVIELGTSNGSITVLLPANISAYFNAATINGIVTISGFQNVEYQVNVTNQKIGTIGYGGASIHLSTVNGNIEIVSQ
ncbi:MAG: hypothetical protein U9R60_18195 [Bacteroidota bacterium]|nr:hypothetical protein [Bacteroidota bacterium]